MGETWEKLYSLDIMKESFEGFDIVRNLTHRDKEVINFWEWYYKIAPKEYPDCTVSKDEYETLLNILVQEIFTPNPKRPQLNNFFFHMTTICDEGRRLEFVHDTPRAGCIKHSALYYACKFRGML